MIRSQHEYEVAEAQAEKIRRALQQSTPGSALPIEAAQQNSLQLLLADLESEMTEYQASQGVAKSRAV